MPLLLQDYNLLITAKKLDDFTFNAFTFSYPITSKSFSKYMSDLSKDRSAKI